VVVKGLKRKKEKKSAAPTMRTRDLLVIVAAVLSPSRKGLVLAVAPQGYVELNFNIDATTNSGSSGSSASTAGSPTRITGVSVNGNTKTVLKLDGMDENIQFNAGGATKTFTVAFWMSRQATNGGNRNYLVEARTGSGTFYWLLDDNPLTMSIMESYDTAGAMPIDSWEHWAYSQSEASGSGTLYRSGAVFKTYPLNVSPTRPSHVMPLWIHRA
jgi:hypothetical protein